MGVVGVLGVPGVDFSADCRGGLCGRVELECLFFVNNLDTLAVAFDVPASTAGLVPPTFFKRAGGLRTISKVGSGSGNGGAGCSSRIRLSSCTVRLAHGPRLRR